MPFFSGQSLVGTLQADPVSVSLTVDFIEGASFDGRLLYTGRSPVLVKVSQLLIHLFLVPD